jgi:D-alanine-D-alanine ligase
MSLTVAVLSGGRSAEHEVSLASGAAVGEGLIAAGHRVLPITIERDGRWRDEQRDGQPIELRPGEGLLGADVAFPALHGPYGEDGTVQGALETLDVAYAGAGVTASAVSLDKVLFKRVLSSASAPSLPQVRYVGVREHDWRERPSQMLSEIAGLGLPVFVKPAHLGSSVGIARVSDADRLSGALQAALAHDELAIVEAAASGIEVECGVLGLPHAQGQSQRTDQTRGRDAVRGDGQAWGDDRLRGHRTGETGARALASEPGEIVVDGRDWYDYEAKYTPGAMELIVPARISATARARVRELALRTFTEVGCEGLARVDFFVDGDAVTINELNTMPGFTPTSVYAKLMAASGIPYPELLDRLCRLGIERHERRRGRA